MRNAPAKFQRALAQDRDFRVGQPAARDSGKNKFLNRLEGSQWGLGLSSPSGMARTPLINPLNCLKDTKSIPIMNLNLSENSK